MPQIFSTLILLCAAQPCTQETATQILSGSFMNASGSQTPCLDFLAHQLQFVVDRAKGPLQMRFQCELSPAR